MKTLLTTVLAVAGFATVSSAIDLTHLKTVDLASLSSSSTAPNWIGNNPSAIAWNGQDLYVGGYNSSAAPTAIAKVGNVLNIPQLPASSFGAFATNASRGITSLAIKGNNLGVSLDNGSGSGDSVRLFDVSGAPALTWRIGTSGPDSSRRGNALDFDPGFNGTGPNQGVAYLGIGSGRRHLLNEGAGTYINGQNAGAIINFNPAQTTWRDMAFDPATGDLYTRESNRVGKAVRNGDNSFLTVSGGQSVVISATTPASNIDNQNLEFVRSGNQGNFIVFNDRASAGAGQAFANVIKMMDANGTMLAINFNGFTAADGNGAYDFSYDSASNTLAISDFANRKAYIFGIPTPGALGLLGMAGLVAARRRRN